MKAGAAEFEFIGNTKDIKKKASGLNNELKALLSTGGKALLGIGTAAANALIIITTNAVKAQGELEQQIGGTEAVFGKLAQTVQNDAAKAFDKMGVSANDYMQYINKMGSLMKGSGLSTQKAMDLSSQAMQRAADVASIMGISVNDAMTAISGAAKGNFTMMDNLGVAMNATSLNAYAMEKGLKKSYKTMTQGEKVELAMQMFLEKSSYAAGNYAKENKTLAGSFNTLKAAAQNLLTGTGNVDQMLSAIENFATILLDKVIVLIPKVADTIIKLINGAIPIISSKLPSILQELVPVLITGITDLTMTLIHTLPELAMLISDMLPELMPQIVDAILLLIPELVKQYPVFVKAGFQLTKGLIKGVWNGIITLISRIGVWTLQIADAAIGKAKEWINIGIEWIKGLWQGIKNKTDWLLDKVKGFKDKVLNGVKSFFGISSPSKEFEIIGKYNIMGLEEGMQKESMKLQDNFDDMFSLSPNLYGTSNTHLSPQINVINNINMKQDALGQMVNDIKTFSGGAKNDYSYGMGA